MSSPLVTSGGGDGQHNTLVSALLVRHGGDHDRPAADDVSNSYWRTNLIVCAINVLLAVGLDFVLGYAGQLNLGQSAFYGIGAYASTLLIIKLGVPFWLAFVLAVFCSPAWLACCCRFLRSACADIISPSPRSVLPLSPIRFFSTGSASPKARSAFMPSRRRRR